VFEDLCQHISVGLKNSVRVGMIGEIGVMGRNKVRFLTHRSNLICYTILFGDDIYEKTVQATIWGNKSFVVPTSSYIELKDPHLRAYDTRSLILILIPPLRL
jgi:hypothetical protein